MDGQIPVLGGSLERLHRATHYSDFEALNVFALAQVSVRETERSGCWSWITRLCMDRFSARPSQQAHREKDETSGTEPSLEACEAVMVVLIHCDCHGLVYLEASCGSSPLEKAALQV